MCSRKFARKLGINVIFGCGYYVQPSHPENIATESVDSLFEFFMSEIEDGIGDTTVRPGAMGEIGTGQPVHDDEWKVLEAACRAQIASGLPLFVHPYPITPYASTTPEVARFILDQGVDPQRVNMCHMDTYDNVERIAGIAELGLFVSLDGCSTEIYFESAFSYRLSDWRRQEIVLRFAEAGYAGQILISQDVCLKLNLTRYGGHGYAHILRNIAPLIEEAEQSGELVNKLMIENPRRILTVER